MLLSLLQIIATILTINIRALFVNVLNGLPYLSVIFPVLWRFLANQPEYWLASFGEHWPVLPPWRGQSRPPRSAPAAFGSRCPSAARSPSGCVPSPKISSHVLQPSAALFPILPVKCRIKLGFYSDWNLFLNQGTFAYILQPFSNNRESNHLKFPDSSD